MRTMKLPMQYHDLRGQTVVVTGGANGIGEAIVRAFHQQGSLVAFCDRDATAGRALARELGPEVRFTRVNLTREREIRDWTRAILRHHGAPRVLINNAAWDPRIPVLKCTTKAWDDLFALNLKAYFLMVRELAGKMRKGAAIVNFGSVTFNLGMKPLTAYVATKGGVVGFTRALARELGPSGIRANTISPGWVMTERQLRMYATPANIKWVKGAQCIPDRIEPVEMAKLALFLASDASSAITGQNIMADKGWVHL